MESNNAQKQIDELKTQIDRLADYRSQDIKVHDIAKDVCAQPEIADAMKRTGITVDWVLSRINPKRDDIVATASEEISAYNQIVLSSKNRWQSLLEGKIPPKPGGPRVFFYFYLLILLAPILAIWWFWSFDLAISFVKAVLERTSPYGWTLVGLAMIVVFAGSLYFYYAGRERRRALDAWDKLATGAISDSGLDTIEETLARQTEAILHAVRDKGVIPAIREMINAEVAPSYSPTLPFHRAPGLAEVFDPVFEIPTDAKGRLQHLMETMPGGSIGIAGPRGSGKTTLIRSFCKESEWQLNGRPVISVAVSAPVEYEARDLILHLFASVCRRIRRVKGREPDEEVLWVVPPERLAPVKDLIGSESALRWSRILQIAGLMLIAVGLLAGGFIVAAKWQSDAKAGIENTTAAASGAAESQQAPGAQSNGAAATEDVASKVQPQFKIARDALDAFGVKPGVLVFWGLVVLSIAIALGTMSRRALREKEWHWAERNQRLSAPGSGLEREALQWLRAIKFQQSFTSGWSGTLQLPVGLSASLNQAESLAQQPLSLPEIVDNYREFIKKLSQEYSVVIGIDEVDKISSADAARRFLNEIKVIFGLERCFYLVSVSENAISNFERRGLPFRDVFDSSFDTIIYVEYLNLEAAKRLLWRRVVGLPMPFVDLCYCLSGGLARDLIRSCRTLMECAEHNQSDLGIQFLSRSLVRTEVEAKTRAVMLAARDLQNDSTATQVMQNVRVFFETTVDPPSLLDRAIELLHQSEVKLPPDARTRKPNVPNQESNAVDVGESSRQLLSELAVYAIYCASVLEVSLFKTNQKELGRLERSGALDRLVAVRQLLEFNPNVALAAVGDVRRSMQLVDLGTDWTQGHLAPSPS